MDKKVTTRFTSSPGDSQSPGAAMKNDSFLEDMEVFSHNAKIHVSGKDHYITRRTLSPAGGSLPKVIEKQNSSSEEKGNQNTAFLQIPPVWKPSRREISNNDRAQSGSDGNSEKEAKVKIQESKLRNQDNKSKSKPSDAKISESQIRVQNEPNKLLQVRKSLVKDRSRRSGSCKETEQLSEASKENEQPSNLHKYTNFSVEPSKDHPRRSDGARKIDSREIPESVALLSAVKEVVSTYTKEEGMKILRTLHELHILGQASLLKNLMFATDEIRKDLQLGENLGQLKVLMAENERLRENFATLKMKNEDLQRRLEESETIKEENARLKLRLQELIGRKSS